MDTLSFKTRPANNLATHEWFVVDATNQTLGRMCAKIAAMLRGKHKPSYTPHLDCGDFIIIINAEKIKLTGNKLEAKEYITFSGYPGGKKTEVAKNLLHRRPEAVIERAIKGMLPKNRLGRSMFKKLFVYAGDTHPHTAQKPQTLTF